MQEICRKYARNMNETCMKHAKICNKYAQKYAMRIYYGKYARKYVIYAKSALPTLLMEMLSPGT
jgi:hypothetical protein